MYRLLLWSPCSLIESCTTPSGTRTKEIPRKWSWLILRRSPQTPSSATALDVMCAHLSEASEAIICVRCWCLRHPQISFFLWEIAIPWCLLVFHNCRRPVREQWTWSQKKNVLCMSSVWQMEMVSLHLSIIIQPRLIGKNMPLFFENVPVHTIHCGSWNEHKWQRNTN